jgi:hypothetical protein
MMEPIKGGKSAFDAGKFAVGQEVKVSGTTGVIEKDLEKEQFPDPGMYKVRLKNGGSVVAAESDIKSK